jgi:hypothetical protein
MMLVIALSFVKPYDPSENSFHAFMIKIHMHTIIFPCYSSTLEDRIVSFAHPLT